jgi:hypothetical protein
VKNFMSIDNKIIAPLRKDDSAEIEKSKEIRKLILANLRVALENKEGVVGMFFEGADAHDAVDDYSDIDLRIVVAEGEVENAEAIIEKALTGIAPIELKWSRSHPKKRISQSAYHLAGTYKFLYIDVLVEAYSDNTTYKAGEFKTIFDKKGLIREAVSNQEEKLIDRIRSRVEDVEKYNYFRQVYIEKAVRRGSFLEARNYMQIRLIDKLVEMLRLLYCPDIDRGGFLHIDKDLPTNIVEELEDISKFNSFEEMEEKRQKANELLSNTIQKIKEKYQFER